MRGESAEGYFGCKKAPNYFEALESSILRMAAFSLLQSSRAFCMDAFSTTLSA